MSDSIFSARARRSSPAIQTVRGALASATPPERIVLRGAPQNDLTPPPAPSPAGVELQVAAILDEQPALGETIAVCFARKELALRALFGALDVATACALHKRIQIGSASDPIVIQLGRMTADRRQRLVTFLGDARRRAASRR